MGQQRLIQQRTGKTTESGLYLGIFEADAPLWIDGENIIFRDGGVEKIKGWQTATSVTDNGTIRGMAANQDEGGTQRIYFGTQDALYSWDAVDNAELGTGFSGNEDESSNNDATHWSFAPFGNWMIATNGIDTPQIHKPDTNGDNAVDLSGLSAQSITKAKIAARVENHIVLLNTKNGNVINFSSADDPETWQPTSTNSAGELYVRNMSGEIKAAVNFEDRLAFFGENEMLFLNYLGDPLYFGYERVLSGIGAIGINAVTEANRTLYGLSRGGFWQSDGVDFQYIDQLAVHNWFWDNVNEDQITKIVATHDAVEQNVIWFFPETGQNEPSAALVYHYPTGAWSYWSFGRSAAVPQSLGVYPKPYYAEGTTVYRHNDGESADGSSLTARVRTKALDLGQPTRDKFVDTVITGLRDYAGTLQVRMGHRYALNDSISWSAFKDVTTDFQGDHIRTAGRFLNVEWQSSGTGDRWKLSGFELYGKVRGSRR